MEENWTKQASTPAAPGAILRNVRSVYSELSDEVLTRWGREYGDSLLFSGGMRFSDGGTVLQNKFLNSVVEQQGFLAAFTGVSTTAGHDCLFEQSYPFLLNEKLGRLLATAGVKFKAINVAMGNTRVAPYSWCVDAHAGLDADIISWDMSMMLASNQCGRAATGVELFIRSASVLPKRPAVLLTDASPDQDLCTNGHLRQIEKQDQGLSGGCIPDRDLFRVYHDFGLHQISPRSLVPEVTCGDDVFARGRLYNGTEKDFQHPVGWHAGPKGHLLVSDIIFMHYAKVFLSAIERLDAARPGITAAGVQNLDALSSGGKTFLREALGLGEADDNNGDSSNKNSGGGGRGDSSGNAAAFMGGGRGAILPPPAWCTDWRFCKWAGNYRCSDTYFPLGGKEGSRLVDMVSERTPAVLNRNHSEFFVEPSKGQWAVTLNEQSQKIKDYLLVPPPEGFHHPIDMKWVLVGDKDSGPIEFEFETLGIPSGKRGLQRRATVMVGEGEEEEGEEEAAASVDSDTTNAATKGTMEQVEQFDSRVTVCKPDFIDRVAFNDSSQVRFSVDGVDVSVVEVDQQYGMYQGSCVLLDAQVAGRTGNGWAGGKRVGLVARVLMLQEEGISRTIVGYLCSRED
eukprot:g5566.t1